MRSRFRRAQGCWLFVSVAFAVMLSGCGNLSQILTPKVITPTPQPSPTTTPVPPSPSPTASATPAPTATATPVTVLDPALPEATASAGLAAVEMKAGRLVCLRYEDTDADGEPEWLAILHDESGGVGRLHAFVLDGEAAYTLEPAQPEPGLPDVGFGQYATCDVAVRDVNVDGRPEIGIFGHAEGNETLLHLFVWEGEAYRRLGFFAGDGGVKLVDKDGDAEEEIWEGYRVRAAPSLVWYVVHTWENDTYGWTTEHYDWYFADRPQTYPTHAPEYAVIAYYLAVNDRDLPGAYDLLWPEGRPAYETWALGYATTMQVSVGATHPIPAASGADRARVASMVTAWDNEGGVIIGRLWNVEWDVLRTDGGWRLLSSTAELLEEWKAAYWP